MKPTTAFQETPQSDGSVSVTVLGKALTCPICGNQHFGERTSLLNTRCGELFGIAWADKSATNFICTQCGHILWFMA